jgi:hypothetical protein
MKTHSTTLYPFVPADARFAEPLDFFAALRFELQWQPVRRRVN